MLRVGTACTVTCLDAFIPISDDDIFLPGRRSLQLSTEDRDIHEELH